MVCYKQIVELEVSLQGPSTLSCLWQDRFWRWALDFVDVVVRHIHGRNHFYFQWWKGTLHIEALPLLSLEREFSSWRIHMSWGLQTCEWKMQAPWGLQALVVLWVCLAWASVLRSPDVVQEGSCDVLIVWREFWHARGCNHARPLNGHTLFRIPWPEQDGVSLFERRPFNKCKYNIVSWKEGCLFLGLSQFIAWQHTKDDMFICAQTPFLKPPNSLSGPLQEQKTIKQHSKSKDPKSWTNTQEHTFYRKTKYIFIYIYLLFKRCSSNKTSEWTPMRDILHNTFHSFCITHKSIMHTTDMPSRHEHTHTHTLIHMIIVTPYCSMH